LGDFKMPSQPQQQQREKAPPVQQQQQQQQYQGYYSGYGYQPQQQQQAPQRPMPPAENRWMDYRSMGQGMTQPQGQVYNPLNPMAGKYSAPPQPQMGQIQGQMPGQMYKNPMMERPRQPQMGQYYRPPPGSNDGYDRRYQGQGGYQQ
jgi:hypothetical protein